MIVHFITILSVIAVFVCVRACMCMYICVCVCMCERTVNTYILHYGVLLHNFFFIIVLVELYLTAKTVHRKV